MIAQAASGQQKRTTFSGTVQAPPSKSETHRAYLLASLSDRPCTVLRPLRSGDTESTLRALRQLGSRVDGESAVRFDPAPWHPPANAIDCGNSGTTLRLLASATSRLHAPVLLTGDASLRTRPNGGLLAALQALGAQVSSSDGRAPLRVRGPIRPGLVTLPSGSSSQFTSALLLTLPMLEGPSVLTLERPVASAPYLDVTTSMAQQAGLQWDSDSNGTRFHIPGRQTPRAEVLRVGGDWSNAAFWLVAAAITQGDVTVTGLDSASAQGDRAIIHILQSFGVEVHVSPSGVRAVANDPPLTPGHIDVSQVPDLFPILAVLAACSQGTTTLTGAANLRQKESDRLQAMAVGLARMGINVTEGPESLRIEGGSLRGATVACRDDHRIHMAFAVAALAATGPVHLDSSASVSVSYPDFHRDLAHLAEAA